MTFSGSVDDWPRNRWLHFGDVSVLGGTLTSDKDHSMMQGPRGFNHKSDL